MASVDVDPLRAPCAEGRGDLGRAQPRDQLHGLTVTGGVSPRRASPGSRSAAASAGSVPMYGFSIDILRSAQVVTADGRVLTASADEHPDLFWGCAGAAGNSGW